MNITALEFKAKKTEAFYHASTGGTVTIAHDRYPNHRFELKARPIISATKNGMIDKWEAEEQITRIEMAGKPPT